MDQPGDLAQSLRPGDRLFKADIEDAYYHLRLKAADQLYLAFRVAGVVYVPLCLNCGLSMAPWFFTKAMRPVVAHLGFKDHRVYSYLDDFFRAAAPARRSGPATAADTARAGRKIAQIFARLGLRLTPTECQFSGRQALQILDILVDTAGAQFLLTPGKLQKVQMAAGKILAHAASHRRYVSARALCSLAGLGNSTSLAVVDARLRLREIFDALRGQPSTVNERDRERRACLDGREIHCGNSIRARALTATQPRLTHAAMRDLQWWARLSTNPHVGRAVWPTPAAVVFTDASMRGWGAVWNGTVSASRIFDARNEGASIKELELLSALHGVHAFAAFARGR